MMKIQKSFFIILVMFLLGCKSVPYGYHLINGEISSQHNEKCAKFYNGVKKKWAANDSIPRCHLYNKKLLKEIENNKECLIGIDSNDVKNLFGNYSYPYYIYEQGVYSISKDCKDTLTGIFFSDYKLNFIYSNSGKVINVHIDRNYTHTLE